MVSIIIPVYNGEEFLEECLDSVIGQSYRDIEIIIIDDGSTDRSFSICQKYADKDSRIKLIHQENAGVSAARNHGLSVAQGEYVMFVDADDMLPEDSVQDLLQEIKPGIDLVAGSYREIKGLRHKDRIFPKKEYDFLHIDKTMDWIISPWAKLFRLEIIKENKISYKENIYFAEDHIFNLGFCKYAKKICSTNSLVYLYRMGGIASTIKYHQDMHRFNVELINTYCDFYNNIGISKEILRRKVKEQFIVSVVHYISNCSDVISEVKIKETLDLFSPYITEDLISPDHFSPALANAVLEKNAKKIIRIVKRENWLPIFKKRVKRLYYRFFTKRI